MIHDISHHQKPTASGFQASAEVMQGLGCGLVGDGIQGGIIMNPRSERDLQKGVPQKEFPFRSYLLGVFNSFK